MAFCYRNLAREHNYCLLTRWPCNDNDNVNFKLYKSEMGVFWSRHHSWCCVKGRLHAAARRRRVRKYCQCGKGGRRFRRPRWLMFRKRLSLVYGCAPCSESYNCCHETSPTLKLKLPPSKSILQTPQISPKSNLKECACTKIKNCGDKMVQQAAIQNLCRFTVDAYFT